MSMLKGRLAVVTGGARGIGLAICRVFAKEGAKVVVADLDKDACQKAVQDLEGGDHLPIAMDVGEYGSVQEVSQMILKHYDSPANVVVNNAGITKDGFLLKMTEQDFDDVIKVNLKGTYNVNKIFAQAMKDKRVEDGSIINLSSLVGTLGNIGQTNYAATKSGVIGFTKSAAKELARFKIRVNAISPGFIHSPMTDKMPDHIKQMFCMQIPLGQFGQPEDIADVAAFLASTRSRYVTGANIHVNGGLI